MTRSASGFRSRRGFGGRKVARPAGVPVRKLTILAGEGSALRTSHAASCTSAQRRRSQSALEQRSHRAAALPHWLQRMVIVLLRVSAGRLGWLSPANSQELESPVADDLDHRCVRRIMRGIEREHAERRVEVFDALERVA
jgi:hypothetical protein